MSQEKIPPELLEQLRRDRAKIADELPERRLVRPPHQPVTPS